MGRKVLTEGQGFQLLSGSLMDMAKQITGFACQSWSMAEEDFEEEL